MEMNKNNIIGTWKLDRGQNYYWTWYSRRDREWNVEHWIHTKEVIDTIKQTGEVVFGIYGNRRLDLYDGELIIQVGPCVWHWLDIEDLDYDY
jgi:hypothetical protein